MLGNIAWRLYKSGHKYSAFSAQKWNKKKTSNRFVCLAIFVSRFWHVYLFFCFFCCFVLIRRAHTNSTWNYDSHLVANNNICTFASWKMYGDFVERSKAHATIQINGQISRHNMIFPLWAIRYRLIRRWYQLTAKINSLDLITGVLIELDYHTFSMNSNGFLCGFWFVVQLWIGTLREPLSCAIVRFIVAAELFNLNKLIFFYGFIILYMHTLKKWMSVCVCVCFFSVSLETVARYIVKQFNVVCS